MIPHGFTNRPRRKPLFEVDAARAVRNHMRLERWLALLLAWNFMVWTCTSGLAAEAPPTRWPSTPPAGWNLTLIQTFPTSAQIIALASEPELRPGVDSASATVVLTRSVNAQAANKAQPSRIYRLKPSAVSTAPWLGSLAAESHPQATGLACGYQGLFVATPSQLLFLQDTNHDGFFESSLTLLSDIAPDKGSTRRFSHLRWGPDGFLYGILAGSGFRDLALDQPGGNATVHLNPGVVRYHPRNGRFELVSDGPAEPVALEVSIARDLRVMPRSQSAILEVVPGSTYLGPNEYPLAIHGYAIPLIPQPSKPSSSSNAWVDVSAPLSAEAGWGSEWAGTRIALSAGSQEMYQLKNQSVGGGVGLDVRRIISKPGPGMQWTGLEEDREGALWLMTRQTASGIEQIWKASPTTNGAGGTGPGLASKSTPFPAPFESCTNLGSALEKLQAIHQSGSTQQVAVLKELAMRPSTPPLVPLQSGILWALHGLNVLESSTWNASVRSPQPGIRATALRIASENPTWIQANLELVAVRLQDNESEPRTAALLAMASLFEGLTPELDASRHRDIAATWLDLWESAMDSLAAPDLSVNHALVWRGTEALFLSDPVRIFERLLGSEGRNPRVREDLTQRCVKRAFGTGRTELVEQLLETIEASAQRAPALTLAALEGIAQGQRGSKRWTHHKRTLRLLASLSSSPDREIAHSAERLEALTGNPATQKRILSRMQDPNATREDRIQSIQFAQNFNSPDSRLALLQLLQQGYQSEIQPAAVEALGMVGKKEEGRALLALWPGWQPELRKFASRTLSSRPDWLGLLVDALESRRVNPSDLSPEAMDAIRQSPNPELRQRAARVLPAGPAK